MTMRACQSYLRPDVVAEPLIGRWYAWVQLVSPVTAALNVARRHVPVMRSYINSPALHAAAAQTHELLGGRFLDCGGDRVEEIRALLAWTEREQSELLTLASAVQELHAILETAAGGLALETLYPRVPEPLRGLVELEYDLYGRPHFRVLEPLAYRSRFYKERHQAIALSVHQDDGRPFMLSTPRLDDPAQLVIEAPFRDEGFDALFSMRARPGCPDELKERLGVGANQGWERLFWTTPPPPRPRFEGPGVRVRYFGHASLLIETSDVSIMIDPVLGYPVSEGSARYVFSDLPERIDYVLITHHHQDHIQLETLLQLRHRVGTVVVGRSLPGALLDPSLELLLGALGFSDVIGLELLQALAIPGGRIIGLPFLGEHHDLAIRSRLAYRVEVAGRSLAAMADTCNVEPEVYVRVRELTGPLDVLFLGMECVGSPLTWSYGALLPKRPAHAHDQSRRGRGSNFVEGSALVEALDVGSVCIYAMGQEPWLRHILGLVLTEESPQLLESQRLIDWCRGRGISAQRLYAEAELHFTP